MNCWWREEIGLASRYKAIDAESESLAKACEIGKESKSWILIASGIYWAVVTSTYPPRYGGLRIISDLTFLTSNE